MYTSQSVAVRIEDSF